MLELERGPLPFRQPVYSHSRLTPRICSSHRVRFQHPIEVRNVAGLHCTANPLIVKAACDTMMLGQTRILRGSRKAAGGAAAPLAKSGPRPVVVRPGLHTAPQQSHLVHTKPTVVVRSSATAGEYDKG